MDTQQNLKKPDNGTQIQRRTGITCIADGRLRTLCSLILRHMGFRVLDTDTPDLAVALIATESASVLIAGTEGREHAGLMELCSRHEVECIHVDMGQPIDSLLVLLERRAAPRL
jgi:hypothetical protein